MRTLKTDRDSCLRNHEILKFRDYRSENHVKEINDDDSGAFHVSFTLALSLNGVSKLHRGNISLRDTRRFANVCIERNLESLGVVNFRPLESSGTRFTRATKYIFIAYRSECVDLSDGMNPPYSRLLRMIHPLLCQKAFNLPPVILSLSLSPSFCPHREINARHKVQWNARP